MQNQNKPKQSGGNQGGPRRGSWRGPNGAGGNGNPNGPRNSSGGGGGTSGMVRLGSSPSGKMRTDVDISSSRPSAGPNSGNGRFRELQPWGASPGAGGSPAGLNSNTSSHFPSLGSNQQPGSVSPQPQQQQQPSQQSPLAGLMNAIGLSPSSPSPSPNPSNQTKAQKDAETFGALASEYNNVGQWDQFAENAKKFGTRTDYDENLYTTRLNRGKGKDWDDKVKMAEQLEREILGGKSENSHIAEERGQVGAGEELDEEDKYSGVRRKKGGNAYVPPALRRIVSPSQSNETPLPSVDEATQPTVKIEAPKEDVKQEEQKVPVVNVIQADTDKEKKEEKKENRTPEKLRTGTPRGSGAIKGDIQGFVEHEKEKLQKQRENMQNMAKAERERKVAELKKFGATFKIPGAKGPEAQSTPSGGSLRTSPAAPASKTLAGTPSAQPTPKPAAAQPVVAANQPKPKVKMVIPEIPPFQRAGKAKPSPIPIEPTADLSVPVVKAEDAVVAPVPGAVKEEAASSVASPAAGVAKLNPGASTFVFKPNPKASNFTPGGASADNKKAPSIVADGTAAAQPSIPPAVARNPFFGTQIPKRTPGVGVNVREDFNPFRGKVVDAKNIPVNWPFAGKKFLSALHPTGAYMTAPPIGMEEEQMVMQGHPGAPMMNQFAMGPNGPYPPYRVQPQAGFPMPGSPAQPGMPNGHFTPYGPAGGFYVQQGGPNMGGPGAPNLFTQGPPPFGNNPGPGSPMMVNNAMLRPAGNPVYYVQPPVMSHPGSPHPYPALPQAGLSLHPPPGPGPNV